MSSVHLTILATLVVLVSSRARLGRSNDLGVESRGPTFSDDLRKVQNAVKTELRRESASGTLGSGEYLASALEKENSDAPWWKRLVWYFQHGFGNKIKASLRKAFDDHFAPALRKGLDHHVIPNLRNQLE